MGCIGTWSFYAQSYYGRVKNIVEDVRSIILILMTIFSVLVVVTLSHQLA